VFLARRRFFHEDPILRQSGGPDISHRTALCEHDPKTTCKIFPAVNVPSHTPPTAFFDPLPRPKHVSGRTPIRDRVRVKSASRWSLGDPWSQQLCPLCPVLCLPPNPTNCYRVSRGRWKALLDKALVALGRSPSHFVQVADSSCVQSLGAGGRRFKSYRPDQYFNELWTLESLWNQEPSPQPWIPPASSHPSPRPRIC
jgi:hypothetical protein